ncbi:hypothetical protein B0H19DRAFT_1066961 [Mycena capillaripes]|nr:hypothetical protein B0H19DRAFT_1066961 [Mycena capillaripes]
MLDLPPELQAIIVSLLDKEDLWVLVHVSRFIPQLSLLPLLSQYKFTASQIYSGSLCIPAGAYFLIPMIYHIHPIQQLFILSGALPMTGIPSALAAVPLIPDVEISGTTDANRDSNVARIIETSSRNGRDPVVIVGLGIVRVSRPSRLPQIQFWTIPRVRLSALIARAFFTGFIYVIPFCFYYVIFNAYLSLTWFHLFLMGPPWDQLARIAADLDGMRGRCLTIRTIAVPGDTPFTLATFSAVPIPGHTLCRLPTLSPAQYTAFLAVLNLQDDLSFLTVQANSGLNFAVFQSFIRRHHLLQKLTLKSGAIDSASLAEKPTAGVHPGQLTVRTLNLDLTQCERAQTHPWRTEPDTQPEAPLSTVRHLGLIGHFEYCADDTLRLPLWLSRFPALVSLEFRGLSVTLEREIALAQAIAQMRPSGEWQVLTNSTSDIVFPRLLTAQLC